MAAARRMTIRSQPFDSAVSTIPLGMLMFDWTASHATLLLSLPCDGTKSFLGMLLHACFVGSLMVLPPFHTFTADPQMIEDTLDVH